MPNKFNPDDLKNPLYEHSQVVTVKELLAMYQGLVAQHRSSSWWEFRYRYTMAIAGHLIYELLTWVHAGKPILRNTEKPK